MCKYVWGDQSTEQNMRSSVWSNSKWNSVAVRQLWSLTLLWSPWLQPCHTMPSSMFNSKALVPFLQALDIKGSMELRPSPEGEKPAGVACKLTLLWLPMSTTFPLSPTALSPTSVHGEEGARGRGGATFIRDGNVHIYDAVKQRRSISGFLLQQQRLHSIVPHIWLYG